MSYIALIAWIVTALAGLYLLTIWLIEYDPDFQRAAATRLPIPVLCCHVLFALGGLGTWLAYLISDKKIYCWAAVGVLALIATLGFTMAIRWLGVYRANPRAAAARPSYAAEPFSRTVSGSTSAWEANGTSSSGSAPRTEDIAIPPERHFPVPLVLAHGIFAVTTVTLVVSIAIGIGGS